MRKPSIEVGVFVGYQIDSEFHKPNDFTNLGDALRDLLSKHTPSIAAHVSYGKFPAGVHLWHEVVRKIEQCDIVILDISENNPNVLLEAGLAFGKAKYVVLLRCDRAIAPIPTDVNAFVYCPYSTISSKTLLGDIARAIERSLDDPKDKFFYFKKLWSFDPSVRTYVVPGNLPSDYGANPFEDFIRLRNRTDIDAVFLVTETLMRLYPEMTVLIHSASCSNDLPDDWRDSNLVLVGGPDFNPLVEEFLDRCPIEYKYGDKAEVWLRHKHTEREYLPSFETREHFRIANDHGFFLKTAVSQGSRGKLVLLGGSRTWGVYGAAMLLGCRGILGETSSVQNVRGIVDEFGSDPSFIVTIKVTGSSDGIHPPSFSLEDVESLETM